MSENGGIRSSMSKLVGNNHRSTLRGVQKELAVVPTPLLERKWPGTHSPMASGVGHVGCHLTYIIVPKGWDNITKISTTKKMGGGLAWLFAEWGVP